VSGRTEKTLKKGLFFLKRMVALHPANEGRDSSLSVFWIAPGRRKKIKTFFSKKLAGTKKGLTFAAA